MRVFLLQTFGPGEKGKIIRNTKKEKAFSIHNCFAGFPDTINGKQGETQLDKRVRLTKAASAR